MTHKDEIAALKRWFPDADELCAERAKPRPSMPLTLRQFLQRERAEGRDVMVPGEVYIDDLDRREAIITRKTQMAELLWVAAISGWGAAIFLAVMWGLKK